MNKNRKQRTSVGQRLLPRLSTGPISIGPISISRIVPHAIVTIGVLACAHYAGALQAAGEISQVQTSDQPGTPTEFTVDGVTYTWGMGENQIMNGFSTQDRTFQFAGTADRVELVRDDLSNASTGSPCGVFVERLGDSSEVLKANYPSDGTDSGNCDMAAMLAGRVVNRGALDLFSNTGPNPKNVERVDYIYDRGVLAPLTASALAQSGHVVAEKSGNNPLQIAAITDLDVFGQPSAYGPLVMVERNSCSGDTICYGITNLEHRYAFFQTDSFAPQGYPTFLRTSTEPVGMAFVSHDNLGIDAGQVYYGFSYFADDVDPSVHSLIDVSTFPDDTNDEAIVFGDGPDIYGGVAGYYLGVELNVATGAAFKDENGDGQNGDDEAGISDISLTLYQDTNGNGVYDENVDTQLGQTTNTGGNGDFSIPGLDNGVYFLLLDESDPDLPPALSLAPGSNPAMFVIQGNDADGVNFSFVSETGSGGGVDAGTTDAGVDAGGVDAGATDAGVDAGGVDAGATDAGVDAGGVDAGAADAGVDAGGVDAGATDAGVDAGGVDAGATDAGVDAGGVDAGATDAGVDAGGVDAGATDAGVDAGGIDGDATDAGVDAGATDAGVDAGSTDAGSGNTDDGFADGAGETAANSDSTNVTQGSSATIDVLANDSDGVGLGLTIIGTPESQNATIVNQNGVLIYTPDFGFIGPDSFLYVIEDGAGTQSTGTVAVEILKYVDLNQNGLNDYVECNCENLTIEVGIEGSALGSSSWFSFLMLTFMIFFRRIVRFRCSTGATCGELK